jgi:hypothetical protein
MEFEALLHAAVGVEEGRRGGASFMTCGNLDSVEHIEHMRKDAQFTAALEAAAAMGAIPPTRHRVLEDDLTMEWAAEAATGAEVQGEMEAAILKLGKRAFDGSPSASALPPSLREPSKLTPLSA